MSQSVDRLKELLFESESRALNDIEQRLSKSETERRLIENRLEEVFSRSGTEERFRRSVATVLDGALRHAETERHAELADAVAPLVVRTIRTEILNSRDELVEALYPMTGRMVKAYVASAISDLAHQINRKVDSNPVMLRLRSLVSGKSVADLALADSGLQVAELYLIRRGTGELVEVWPQSGDGNRNQTMSGVLAAINEFASDAFGETGTALRQIDMGDSRVYLRASPIYLLAARCTGIAPPSAESLIDDAFLSAIDTGKTQGSDTNGKPVSARATLSDLSEQLTTGFAELTQSQRRSQISPAFIMASLIGILLAGLGAWIVLDRHFVNSALETARSEIAATPGTKGYLIDVNVSPFARRVSLTGLTPDDSVKSNILTRVKTALPGSIIQDHLTPLPGAHGEIGPAIEGAAIAASMDRASQRLDQALSDLQQIAATTSLAGHRETVDRATADARNASQKLKGGTPPANADLPSLISKLRQRAADIASILSPKQRDTLQPAPAATGGSNAAAQARNLEVAADRLATVAAAVLQAQTVKDALPEPQPQVVRSPDLTAFERLAIFMRSHAVFFNEDLKYRDEARTNATLDELAKLLRGSEAFVRVVGYTDARGNNNSALSAERANKVAEALVARGVARDRLVSVGRQDANQIAGKSGDTSPNRRVEFELGFDGEASP